MNDANENIYEELWNCKQVGANENEEEMNVIDRFDEIIEEFDPLTDTTQHEFPPDTPLPPPRSDSLRYGSVDSNSFNDPTSDDPFRGENLFQEYPPRPTPRPRGVAPKAPSASSMDTTDSSNDPEAPPPRRLGPSDFDGESIENLDFDSEDGIVPPHGAIASSPKQKVVLKPMNKSQRVDKTRSGELFVTDYTKRKFCKRWCVLDVVDKVFRVYSDNKSNVTKRMIPLPVISNVKSVPLSDDKIFRYELIISPPAVSGVPKICRPIIIGHKDQVELSEWATTIMKLIIDRSKENGDDESSVVQNSLGHKLVNCLVSRKIEKYGFVKMRGVHGRRLFAIIGPLLVYFDSIDDFSACMPVHLILMKIANVKPITRYPNTLELNTPSTRTYFLTFDHPEDMESWNHALSNATKLGLSGEDDSAALLQARENPSNNFCADCGSNDTVWASVNFGLVICTACSGLHRELGAKPTSKVRGLEYDSRWTDSALKLLVMIGNDNGNKFWEANLPAHSELKPKPDWPIEERRDFIVKKYREKAFADLHPLRNESETLIEMMRTSVQTGSLLETMRIHFSLDHDFCIDDTDLVKLAKDAGQVVQTEFLIQNSRWFRSSISGSQRRSRPMTIIKKGFVSLAVNISDPSFTRRWCTLAGGTAHFHMDEKDAIAKESLDLANDVVTISFTEEGDANEPTITLFTNQRAFCVRSMESDPNDLHLWLHAFCRSSSPDVCKDYLQEEAVVKLLLVGRVFVKYGKTTEWSNYWACLTTTRRLLLLDESLESNHVEDLDLRLVTTPINDQEETAGQRSFCFHVISHSTGTISISRGAATKICFRAYNDYLTKRWRSKVSTASTRCGNNLQDQVLTLAGIPLILSQCIDFVNIHAKETSGLYRVSGTKSKEEELYEIFKKCPQSVHLKQGDWDACLVANVLKKFLRGLEDPPMTREYYEKWLEAAKMPEHNLKLQWYQYYLRKLPEENYLSLRAIFMHINFLLNAKAAGQSMDAHGMALIFAQVLLSVYKDGLSGASSEVAIIHDFITYYVWLFEIDEEEQRRQEEEQRAIDRIYQLQQSQNASPEPQDCSWKISVVLDVCFPDDPPVCQVDVSAETTAQDVLKALQEKGKLNVLKHLALFEIVVEKEVERDLFSMESVYDVCMNWRNFSDEYRSKVKLCVKQNYIVDRFERDYQPDVSMKADVQYSSACRRGLFNSFKNFSGRVLILQDKSLKILKGKVVVEDWDVRKIDVYHGIEKRRKPANEFGITLRVRGEEDNNEVVSLWHAISFNARQDLYRWLAAIYYAKYDWCPTTQPGRERRSVR